MISYIKMTGMINLKTVNKKIYIVVGLAMLLTAGYTFAAAKIPIFYIIRENAVDLLMRQRHSISPLPREINDITIITIDEESLSRLRQRWPMSRGIYAALLKGLSSANARPLAIGMDLFFTGQSEVPEDDILLAEAMQKSANSVIVSYMNETGAIIEPEGMLAKPAAGVGFVSAPRGRDLVVREMYPAALLTEGSFKYSFPVLTYAQFRGIECRDVVREMPLDPAGGIMRVNYFGKLEDFKTIPLWKALLSPDDEYLFKNKVVLIGTVIEVHHDVYPTPLGIMPGVAINANIVMNLMSKRWLVLLPPWITFLALLAGVIISGGVTYRFGIPKGAAASVCLIVLAFILASVCIIYDRIFDFFGFSLMVIFSFIGISVWMGLSTFIENKRLNNMAIIDALTGAFTYRYFDLILKGEKVLIPDKNAEVSLALFDVDHFKKINDTYGHGAGNDVLRGVAAAIKDLVPASGVVARFGGDEFAAIMPGTGSVEAHAIASEMVRAVRYLAFAWLPKGAVITISVGVVTTKYSPEYMGKEILKAADAELYKAKASGKDRVSAAI